MKLFQHEKVVCEKHAGELTVQVVDRGELRELRFGNRVTQSAAHLRAPHLLALDYTRAMMAGATLPPQVDQVLHIGLGAGSLPRYIHHYFPRAQQRVVELVPEVVEIAYRFFELPVSPRLEVLEGEAAEFLRDDAGRYDLIFQDAFHAEGVARHLHSGTFFAQARQHLRPEGWLVTNVWGSDRDGLERARANLGEQFIHLLRLSVRVDSNVILFASNTRQPPGRQRIQQRAAALEAEAPLEWTQLAGQIRRDRPADAPGPRSVRSRA